MHQIVASSSSLSVALALVSSSVPLPLALALTPPLVATGLAPLPLALALLANSQFLLFLARLLSKAAVNTAGQPTTNEPRRPELRRSSCVAAWQ